MRRLCAAARRFTGIASSAPRASFASSTRTASSSPASSLASARRTAESLKTYQPQLETVINAAEANGEDLQRPKQLLVTFIDVADDTLATLERAAAASDGTRGTLSEAQTLTDELKDLKATRSWAKDALKKLLITERGRATVDLL
eukprot:m.50773 g.50773  ORF g.50773 m.50773 type:complete len:145 (+) comp12934_c0_seq1:101-535(+)